MTNFLKTKLSPIIELAAPFGKQSDYTVEYTMYYWENGKLSIDSEISTWANKFIDGYKKTIAQKKARGIMSITEGRSSLSYSGYNAICHAMMTMQPVGRRFTYSESLFAWPYMILSWNLMSRCGNIAEANWAADLGDARAAR